MTRVTIITEPSISSSAAIIQPSRSIFAACLKTKTDNTSHPMSHASPRRSRSLLWATLFCGAFRVADERWKEFVS